MSTLTMSAPITKTAAQRSGLYPASRSEKRQREVIKGVRKGLRALGLSRRVVKLFSDEMPTEAEMVDNYWRHITQYNLRGFVWFMGLGKIRGATRANRKVYREVYKEDPKLAPYATMMFALGYDWTKMRGMDGSRVVELWTGSVEFDDAITYTKNDLDDDILAATGIVLTERRHHLLMVMTLG